MNRTPAWFYPVCLLLFLFSSSLAAQQEPAAYELGAQAHEGQRRYSGEQYITHPVAVAGILADLHLDYQSIAAAIMHDVIEDTPTAKEQIADQFGQEIAGIVDGVSKLDQLSFDSRAEAQVESFRKMMLRWSKISASSC